MSALEDYDEHMNLMAGNRENVNTNYAILIQKGKKIGFI